MTTFDAAEDAEDGATDEGATFDGELLLVAVGAANLCRFAGDSGHDAVAGGASLLGAGVAEDAGPGAEEAAVATELSGGFDSNFCHAALYSASHGIGGKSPMVPFLYFLWFLVSK